MSVWITDRLPTVEDADPRGQIWCMDTTRDVVWMHYGVYLNLNKGSADIVPWQPIIYPEPYVKPKVWVVNRSGVFKNGIMLYPSDITEREWTIIEDALNRLEAGI